MMKIIKCINSVIRYNTNNTFIWSEVKNRMVIFFSSHKAFKLLFNFTGHYWGWGGGYLV